MNLIQSYDASKKKVDYVTSLTLKMGLYKSAHTPAASDTFATYTAIEADFSGYARQNTSGWGAAAIVAGRAVSTGTQLNFTHSGGGVNNTVYGAFLFYTVAGTDYLYGAGEDPSPFVMNAAGLTYAVVPQVTDKSEY